MKKHIVKALKWALNKFEDKTVEIAAWPFPAPEPVKKKVIVPKATTVAKKATAKKTTKKAK